MRPKGAGYLAPLLSCLFASAAALQAADFELQRVDLAPPEELPAALKDLLGGKALQISRDGQVVAEFWLREEVPVKESGSGALGVSFDRLEVSTLMGAIRLHQTWLDYRDSQVSPGLYTLRYGVQPADGSHMGVSFYRDFMLLCPASEDPDPEATYSYDQLVELSKKAASRPHPAVLALFPVTGGETPKLVKNDLGQWTLAAEVGPLLLGLVIHGHGEVEG